MLDFGIDPPEVTSAKMYSGPGSGPLMAAAAAWDQLASALESMSHGYSAAIAGLQGQGWSGPASAAMSAAAAPYVEWTSTTAAQAEQVAVQLRTAATAYETAHAATVPPAAVTANRSLLAQLVASNVFGQNTPHIADTEFEHSDMWAQDTSAMYGYAHSSSGAATLAPFSQPPQTTNPAGGLAQNGSLVQSAASTSAGNSQTGIVQLLQQIPQQLQQLSQGGTSGLEQGSTAGFPGSALSGQGPLLTSVGNFNTLLGPANLAGQALRSATNAGGFITAVSKGSGGGGGSGSTPVTPPFAEPPHGATVGASAESVGSAAASGAREAVLAGAGTATPVGALSVPQTWADATPVAVASDDMRWLSESELATPSWEAATPAATASEGGSAGAGPMAGLGPMAGAAGAAGRPSVASVLRVGPRRYAMPRPASGG
jgi:PPE-repeat protein